MWEIGDMESIVEAAAVLMVDEQFEYLTKEYQVNLKFNNVLKMVLCNIFFLSFRRTN